MSLEQICKAISLAGNGPELFYTKEGNLFKIANANADSLTSAIIAVYVNKGNQKIHIDCISLRPTVDIVVGEEPGQIIVEKASNGTAIASATEILAVDIDDSVLGADTTETTDYTFDSGDTAGIDVLLPGDILIVRSVAGTDTDPASATGKVQVTIQGHCLS